MIPSYLNSSSSTSTSFDQASSSNPLSSDHFFNYPVQNQEANNFGPHDDQEVGNQGPRLSLWNRRDGHHHDQNQSEQGWMPSKIWLIRKMMKSSHHQKVADAPQQDQMKAQQAPPPPLEAADCSSSSNSSYNTISPIRVCADCNTTKTPLWRSGPRGPKSLCNACGIRQRKARRAMAAAAGGGIETLVVKPKVQSKDKKPSQLKKRTKLAATQAHNNHGRKKPGFEDFLLNLSKNLPFHQVFPQDEKEAAILLMALSCGLVHS